MENLNAYFAAGMLNVNYNLCDRLKITGNKIISVVATSHSRELHESVIYKMTDKELSTVLKAWSEDQAKEVTWQNRQPCDLVVTRHKGLVEYLVDKGIITTQTEVVEHASPEIVKGKHVIGVLPHSLSCLTATFSEVPLKLTADMRGRELTKEDVAKVAGELVTYQVKQVSYDTYYQSFN